MDHVAIMNPKLGLIDKVVSGEKEIESRWMKNKSAPWLKVFAGDQIYFKESGGLVVAKAEVQKVEYIDELNARKSKLIIKKYGKKICMDRAPVDKNYCVLIWMINPKITELFKINKKGFGAAAAWLSVEDINLIKLE